MVTHDAIRKARALGPTALYLYATLIELAAQQGRVSRCETTNTELAIHCDVTERTIQRTLMKLLDAGLIGCPTKGNGRGLRSVYTVAGDTLGKGDIPSLEEADVTPVPTQKVHAERVTPVSPAEDLAWLLNHPDIKALKAEYHITDSLLRRSLKILVDGWQGVDRAGNPNRPVTARARASRAVSWIRAGEREGGQHVKWRQEAPWEMAGVNPV